MPLAVCDNHLFERVQKLSEFAPSPPPRHSRAPSLVVPLFVWHCRRAPSATQSLTSFCTKHCLHFILCENCYLALCTICGACASALAHTDAPAFPHFHDPHKTGSAFDVYLIMKLCLLLCYPSRSAARPCRSRFAVFHAAKRSLPFASVITRRTGSAWRVNYIITRPRIDMDDERKTSLSPQFTFFKWLSDGLHFFCPLPPSPSASCISFFSFLFRFQRCAR